MRRQPLKKDAGPAKWSALRMRVPRKPQRPVPPKTIIGQIGRGLLAMKEYVKERYGADSFAEEIPESAKLMEIESAVLAGKSGKKMPLEVLSKMRADLFEIMRRHNVILPPK